MAIIRMCSNNLFKNRFAGAALILIISASLLGAHQSTPNKFTITADVQKALDLISADSLGGHLSFIASDALEGRNTPSRGLDIAAFYIAAQFRRAGLEPVGDDDYFQTANWILAERRMDSFKLKIQAGKETTDVGKDQVSLSASDAALSLFNSPLVKLDYKEMAALDTLSPREVEGKVIITEIPDYRREDGPRRAEIFRAQNEFLAKLRTLKTALILSIDRSSVGGSGAGAGRLIDPESRAAVTSPQGAPLIRIHDPAVVKAYDAMKAGQTSATVSLELPAPVERPVKLRNCIGLLRGSDPTLKEAYVMVTAHYDHIGMRAGLEGDNIFNGANDDGSGTVSVIELAAALASLKQCPKRSIIFMTFFGEEKGLLGSRYYARHPIFPIEKTVADINLEQVGRTDTSEGPQLASATLTGFDYSDIGETFKEAGRMTGVRVYKHEQNSDPFFARSDNQALADQGVPAHTLCVAFVYPDYHGLGDHWDKIDYVNLEKVNRLIALGLIMLANNPYEPKWNEANPKTARYVKAWKERRF